MSSSERVPYPVALPVAVELARLLEAACDRLAIAGSLRRRKDDIGDLEYVAIPKMIVNPDSPTGEKVNALWWLLDTLVEEGAIEKALIVNKNGDARPRWGAKYRTVKFRDMQCDIFTAMPHNWDYIYWLRTGPGDANQAVMTLNKRYNAPFVLSAGEVFADGLKLNVAEEEDWFKLLGINVIAPASRTPEAYTRALGNSRHIYPVPLEILTEAKPEAETAHQDSFWDLRLYEDDPEKNKALSAGDAPVKEPEWQFYGSFVKYHIPYNQVYVWDSWDETGRTFKLVDEHSNEAAMFRRTMTKAGSIGQNSWLIALQEYLERYDTAKLAVLADVDGYDLAPSILYLVESPKDSGYSTEDRSIPMDSLEPTQDFVYRGDVKHYMRTLKSTDQRGRLPVGFQFIGEHKIYIGNGHSRWYRDKFILKRNTMVMTVIDLPFTLAQACGGVGIEEDDSFLADVLEEVVDILSTDRIYA